MTSIIYIIAFVLLLGIIVLVHELGHFLTAKKFGVQCPEFAIGMGPVIFSKEYKGTKYSLRLLPLGGFVQIAGEEDDSDSEVPFEQTINGIKPWKQLVVMGAGVFLNFVLAFVVFIGVHLSVGKVVVPTNNYEVAQVVANSAASEAGLQKGDIIKKVEYQNEQFNIKSNDDLQRALGFNPGEKCKLVIDRDGDKLILEAKPKYDKKAEGYLLGVSPKLATKSIGFWESVQYGVRDVVSNTRLVFESFGRLLHGDNLNQLSGPVGIFKLVGDVAMNGLLPWLNLLAIISINIGIFNLLPIPILDGGRMVIVIIEKLLGRKLNEKVLNTIMYLGMFAMMGLLLFATFNDITRIFK